MFPYQKTDALMLSTGQSEELEFNSLHDSVTALDDNRRHRTGSEIPATGEEAPQPDRLTLWQPVRLVGCLLFATVLAAILQLKFYDIYYFKDRPVVSCFGLLITGYLLSRFAVASFYRPPPTVVGFTPTVSVVIAAKDEEQAIDWTLECIFRCDYPHDRLEVIAVDDGSTDKTFAEMQRARARFPRLHIIHFPENRGKRNAMAAGVRQATGEILVFVDSDTFLRPDAIRKLVRGFADQRVAAVCGHAFVQNARENHLTRLQELYYYISFRVLKASESVFGTVTCCSGCLSAYRRSAVLEILDSWQRQRFLGVPAIGDDRSLTRHILRRHRILYDREAICTTIAPATVRQFFRQQLRWKKSWIVETLYLSRFFWRRHFVASIFYYAGVAMTLLAPVWLFGGLVLPAFGVVKFSFWYFYGAFLIGSLYGLLYLIRFRNRLWIYGIVFQFVVMVALSWQIYYAMLTLRRNHWGTR